MTAELDEREVVHLVSWITERDAMRCRRESGLSKPWSQDPIMRDHRWCNVRRMDDKVSRWLIDTWYPGLPERGGMWS